MSSIPLPALDIKPQQQSDPMAEVGRLIQMKSLLNQQAMQSGQLQLQQQQIKDQHARTQAMIGWDGKDPNDLAKAVLQNGGSADAATQVQQHFLQVKDTASQIAERDAKTGETNLKTIIEKHNQMLGAINAAEQVPDEQLHDHLVQTINQLIPDGADPQAQQFKQQAMQLLQSGAPPAQIRQQMDLTKATLQGSKEQYTQAQSQAEAKKNTAQAAKDTAETNFYAQNPQAGAPGVPAETVSLMDYMRTPAQPGEPMHTPANYPAWKAKQTSLAEAPVRIATAQAEGAARANIEAQMSRGSNAALANVPPHLVAPASADAQKAGSDFAAAQAVTQRLQALMTDARKGNVVSYQLMPEEGALQVVTNQGIHRINMAEIQNYGGGSLWQRMQGHLGKALTGKSIPSSVLDDMDDIQKIMAEGSQTKYNNTLKTINETYGANFKPVEMAPMARNAGKAGGPPPGATHTAMGSDGKKHYTNSQGQDLGVAP